MFDEQDSKTGEIARRGFLIGVAGVAGVGVLAGRVQAWHPYMKDDAHDAGDLSPGQTAVVQSLTFSGSDYYFIEGATVTLSGVSVDDVDSVTVRYEGSDVGSASVDALSQAIDFSPDVEVGSKLPATFEVAVTLSGSVSEGTLTTSISLDWRSTGHTDSGTTNTATDGAPESIVVPEPKPVAYRQPRFSLVADERSWLEGVDGAERVTVSPEAPRVGETITLEATVTNVGTKGGRYVGRLTNWFEILGREEVYLDVGEKTTLTYEFTFEKAGTHRMFLTDDHVCDITVSR